MQLANTDAASADSAPAESDHAAPSREYPSSCAAKFKLLEVVQF